MTEVLELNTMYEFGQEKKRHRRSRPRKREHGGKRYSFFWWFNLVIFVFSSSLNMGSWHQKIFHVGDDDDCEKDGEKTKEIFSSFRAETTKSNSCTLFGKISNCVILLIYVFLSIKIKKILSNIL